MKILGNADRGRAFVVSAPAGTGKTTLVERLQAEFECVCQSVSLTTRPARENELDGVHYHFVSEDDFIQRIAKGEFLEFARVFGNYYGTSKEKVEEQLSAGKHVVLVIDTQGALQLMGKYPATFIFVAPPSLEELRRRLESRDSETQEKVEERLTWAAQEIAAGKQYEYFIVNDELDVAYEALRSIFIAEEHRQNRDHQVETINA